MLVAAAVCPHPPLLVPEVAAGAAAETADLRAACAAAVATLRAHDAALWVVGAAPETRPYDGVADFAAYGLPPRTGAREAALPLSLAVGAWLAPGAPCHGVASAASPTEAAALGRRLAAAGDVALLVMGDGSARRSVRAPGYLDPRAEAYDAAVAAALRAADPEALLALDPAVSEDLLAAGRAAWQVLAGAAGGRGAAPDGGGAGAVAAGDRAAPADAVARAGGAGAGHGAAGAGGGAGPTGAGGGPGGAPGGGPGGAPGGRARGWRGEVTYEAAPYGVGYVVATWSRA